MKRQGGNGSILERAKILSQGLPHPRLQNPRCKKKGSPKLPFLFQIVLSSRSGVRRHIELVIAGRTFHRCIAMFGTTGRGATGQHEGHQQHSQQQFNSFHNSDSFLPGEEVPVCLLGKPSQFLWI